MLEILKFLMRGGNIFLIVFISLESYGVMAEK